MISVEAIKKILDIRGEVCIGADEMAKHLEVTFSPRSGTKASEQTSFFADKLKKVFQELGVKVIPFEDTLAALSWRRRARMLFLLIQVNLQNWLAGRWGWFNFNWGKRVKPGVAIIAVGEGRDGDLAVDHAMSLRANPMVLIIDQDASIGENSSFSEHMEYALKTFAWNVVNLVVTVGKAYWTTYSFNMSYPKHALDGDFKRDVLDTLISKIYAPVIPPRMSDFTVEKGAFNPSDALYRACIDDLVDSGKIFSQTGLYPEPRRVSDFVFRNSFYRWLGSLLLDRRSGMSYGFMARQLPLQLGDIIPLDKSNLIFSNSDLAGNGYKFHDNKLFVIFSFNSEKYVLRVPEVWALTSRSGTDKTKLDPKKDIIKMGLVNGQMILQTPPGVDIGPDYKPSFDTKVILAHAAANAIAVSVVQYLGKNFPWVAGFQKHGRALAHWHGYFRPDKLPVGWYYYGERNPPVSCSAPQGAIYAFEGKTKTLLKVIQQSLPYVADIHIEPQHGVNISCSSLEELAEYLINNKDITKLGNEYLAYYNKT